MTYVTMSCLNWCQLQLLKSHQLHSKFHAYMYRQQKWWVFFLCSILTSAPIKLKTAKVQANASKYYSWRHYDTFYFLYLFTNRSQRFRKYGSFHFMPKSFTPFRLKAAFVFTMYVTLKCSTLFALSFLDVHISISM